MEKDRIDIIRQRSENVGERLQTVMVYIDSVCLELKEAALYTSEQKTDLLELSWTQLQELVVSWKNDFRSDIEAYKEKGNREDGF